MSYPLKSLARWIDWENRHGVGIEIRCPNCGLPASIWLRNPIDGGLSIRPAGPEWERIGKTFETMRLIPSIRMYGHYHGNVEGGALTVDQTGFQCRTTAWEKNQEETEKPMATDETKAAPQIHHEDAGDVGETGEHGDLGQNAAGAARALPSADDLDKDAAEKAAAAATAGRVVKVPEATDAKPAPNAEEVKAQIAGSLVLAGYSPEEAAKLAATAWANKNG